MSNSALKQEFFEITDSRKKMVRQDRLDLNSSKSWIEWQSKKYEVVNISSFGLAFLAVESAILNLKVGSEHQNVTFNYMGISMQALHLKVARLEKHPTSIHSDWIVGCEVFGDPIKIEKIKAIDAVQDLIEDQKLAILTSKSVPVEFRSIVLEMQHWLIGLKSKVDEIEGKMPVGNFIEEQTYRNTVVEFIGNFIGEVVPSIYGELVPILEKLNPGQLEEATKFARTQLGPYVYGAPFAARAYYKPRGYAGDFEMMNHLYRNEGVGKSLFDQCMHRYFIDEPAGQAVKNRSVFLLSKINSLVEKYPQQKHFRILSIACGPAKEVQMFLEAGSFPRDVTFEFNLLDQDEESLKHAQREIFSIERFVKSGYNFQFHNLAIKNIIARAIPNGKFDLIYSAGLFDYFTEPVATAAASKIYDALVPGGEAIIGNFSKDNPSSVFMELVLDWHLIYRSSEDLKRIFLPVTSKVVVEKEKLGINLFAILKK